jgi:hypothetical protein
VKSFIRIFSGGLSLAAALFIGAANAAEISFDGAGGGNLLVDYAAGADMEVPLAAPAGAGAHVYDFKSLYGSLGYPSPDYFGSSEEELQDITTYTSKEDTFYGEINGYLRFHPAPYEWYGTGPEDAKVIVEHIDRVFTRAPAIPGDLILFRGLGLGWHGSKPFAAGEEFTDKGYVSTSVTYSVARYFALEMGDEEKPERRAIFAIYLTRPSEKGILVDQGEDEVMLPRGRKFRVMAQKAGVAKYDLYLVQACAAACETTLRGDVSAFWDGFAVQD